MSGFSAEWLALREPVDHRSRDTRLADQLAAHVARFEKIAVVDLGCGTGSNLRATAPLLPKTQTWTLVDHDRHLLSAARIALMEWADRVLTAEPLVIEKAGKSIAVTFRQADLAREIGAVLAGGPDLVTASALFDLGSAAFINDVAKAVAGAKAVFYTVLTYNGTQLWTPSHPADAAMLTAFHAHQKTDKGFGKSAGPTAPKALAEAFGRTGYKVLEGDSPWRMGAEDAKLIGELAAGFAAAVAETGKVPAARLADWRSLRRSGAIVGHTDTLAIPA